VVEVIEVVCGFFMLWVLPFTFTYVSISGRFFLSFFLYHIGIGRYIFFLFLIVDLGSEFRLCLVRTYVCVCSCFCFLCPFFKLEI
jgi:hypothetical protein